MSHLVGVPVYQDYTWNMAACGTSRFTATSFDGFQVNRIRLSQLGTSLFLQLQKLDLKGNPITPMIDRLNTRWLRLSPRLLPEL